MGSAAERARAPEVSHRLLRGFMRYVEPYLRRHFHAVRLARTGAPPLLAQDEPLVIYLNHPSWWDPLIGLLLSQRLFPERRHYSPIQAEALTRYAFFARLGFFGLEPGTVHGARRFLAISEDLLSQGGTLWLTPGGRFSDPRERPAPLAPGLGHLAARLRRGTLLPLAVEYPFWEERFPEALLRFGEPFVLGSPDGAARTAQGWTELLAARLAATQDALAKDAVSREASRFETLLGGRAGVGGVYDLWRRLKAR
ncbi:MAG TPA: lysophospholipid acyltransferase family protein, partial [Thermoanaerobaculia bacterium]|nr:lysophospholipid acyltransferase family protein [Thermoanaerobaculia bacterium]